MTKSVASETDVPAGLDVVPMEPGTIVGSRDVQGTDGTTRTDRPGEILGTPLPNADREAARQHEADKHDYVANEVDRANREELPRLGGNIDDNWRPDEAVPSKAAQATADKVAAARATAAPATRTTEAATTSTDSGIKVSPKIDKG